MEYPVSLLDALPERPPKPKAHQLKPGSVVKVILNGEDGKVVEAKVTGGKSKKGIPVMYTDHNGRTWRFRAKRSDIVSVVKDVS